MAIDTSPVETWESNTDARVSLKVTGPRGGDQRLTAYGKGQRIRITAEQRTIAEEGLRDIQNNPFVNGKLTQVAGPARSPVDTHAEEEAALGDQQLTDEELAGTFALGPDDFQSTLANLSQANIFRLRSLLRERGGSVMQSELLNEHIEEHYPVSSGDTKSYREMRQDPVH